MIAARWGVPAGAAHLSISPSQAALTALTRNLAAVLAPGIVVHGLAPYITPAGATGAPPRPRWASTFDDEFLTAEQVGDAVSRWPASARARSGPSTRISSRW